MRMQQRTNYEKTLQFNKITRFLHGNKARLMFEELDKLFDQGVLDKTQKTFFLDIGCGPAYVFEDLRLRYPNLEYLGLEPKEEFCEAAVEKYGSDPRFKINKGFSQDFLDDINKVDVIIAFDCFEHMPLDVRNYNIDLVSRINFKRMFVNIPNEVGPAIIVKNFGSFLMRYVRHREYTFMETLWSGMYMVDKFVVHKNGHKGFDWRVLYTNFRFYFKTVICTSPIKLIPKFLSPSIFMIIRKYQEDEEKK